MESLRNRILEGEFDINNQEIFLSTVLKGFLYDIREKIKVRNIPVPHLILNTGDDIMYLENKGQNHAIEPKEVSNEDFIYNQIPRCIVKPTNINMLLDQMTNPFTRGKFQIDEDGELTTFNAEFRRIPFKISIELEYYLDSYTDLLACIQNLITNLGFVNNYKIIYMGQDIPCSYSLPESIDNEYNISIEGDTQDSKFRKASLSMEIETVMPMYRHKTVIPADKIISNFKEELFISNKDYEKREF